MRTVQSKWLDRRAEPEPRPTRVEVRDDPPMHWAGGLIALAVLAAVAALPAAIIVYIFWKVVN